MNIIIGIIEDDQSQINIICRTLMSHFLKNALSINNSLEFKMYETSEGIDCILGNITKDIEKNAIDFIIVDYKIVTSSSNTNGAEIVKKIKRIVREFPAIILTEREKECAQTMDVDPDKIYSKKLFFQAKNDGSIEAADKIFNNIDRFLKKRDSLNRRINELKKANEVSGKIDKIDEILLLEKELSDYYPSDETSIEKVLDKETLSKIASLIEQANALLEE